MKKRKIYSGYARCCMCRKHNQLFLIRGGCPQCKKKQLEYGVMYRNRFMTYAELKSEVKKGRKFIDVTHCLNITEKTFGEI